MLEKVCVILGAGASRDVYNVGTSKIDEAFKPPLTKELFNLDTHKEYWNIMAPYRGAQVLSSDLGPLIASGNESLEKKLREYADSNSPIVSVHFDHIPAYLRDLLHRVSRNYSNVPSNFVRLIMNILTPNPLDVLFLTLNYDNLLEQALTLFDRGCLFNKITQYIATDRETKVVKLHGSINWFKEFPSDSHGWESSLMKYDALQKVPENQIIIRDDINVLADHLQDSKYLYPIITAPLAGKNILDAVCPDTHLEFARSFISQCKKYLIIGTSGLDEDLLTLLNDSIPSDQSLAVHIVGSNHVESVRDRFVKEIEAFQRANMLESRFPSNRFVIFNEGFDNYLNNQQLSKLLEVNSR